MGSDWMSSREDFFLPVKVLSALFRGKFLDGLKKAYEAGELTFAGQIEGLKEASAFKRFLNDLYDQDWVVYCKPPLRNPQKVMDYLGRYTHRVALSNDRLVKREGSQVTFRWRDSADGNKIKWITLEAFEFIRRFPASCSTGSVCEDPVLWDLESSEPKEKAFIVQEASGCTDGEGAGGGPERNMGRPVDSDYRD